MCTHLPTGEASRMEKVEEWIERGGTLWISEGHQIEEVNRRIIGTLKHKKSLDVFQVTWRCNKHHLLLRTTIWECEEDNIRTDKTPA